MSKATRIEPIEQWPVRLERFIAEHCTQIERVVVFRETDSTQDAARRMNAKPGDAIVAWRQTSGRGRLGRPWADTGEDGVAVTIVVSCAATERLSLAAAVGAAMAAETALKGPVGLKWPNDVVVEHPMFHRQKLAGVLIEQAGQIAMIGIGMNVRQTHWPEELKRRAVSLTQLGRDIDRLEVIEALLSSVDQALTLDEGQLLDEFSKRDVLIGSIATFAIGHQNFTGRVKRVHPLNGLTIDTEQGERFLPASQTTIVASQLT